MTYLTGHDSDTTASVTLRNLSDEADRILMRLSEPLPREVVELLRKLAEAGK